jgi:hypothetical protein
MSRVDYRGGSAPIRTAEELSNLLTIPLFLIVSKLAAPVFPTTDRSHPSVAVGIKTVPIYNGQPSRVLVWIHWTQWQAIIKDVASDDRITYWRNQLKNGELEYLMEMQTGSLYSCDWSEIERRLGKNAEYIRQLQGIIFKKAQEAGF